MLRKIASSIGSVVEARFAKLNYDSVALPDIAFEALSSASFDHEISHQEVLQSIIESGVAPKSHDGFADFGLTLWHNAYFRIELLIWVNSTTSRHQHAFSGAFRLIEGSSCHSKFVFERSGNVNSRMEFGRLQWKSSEILKSGHVERIVAGESFIHSLYHLDNPTMTMVVRTIGEPIFGPQWSYYAPWVRMDPFIQGSDLGYCQRKKTLAVQVGWQCGLEIGDRLAECWLETCDVETAFRFLISEDRPASAENNERWRQRVGEGLRKRWPTDWRFLAESISEERHIREMSIGRSLITDKKLRLILAMLMNVPDGGKIIEIVAKEFNTKNPELFLAQKLKRIGDLGFGLVMDRKSVEMCAEMLSGAALDGVVKTFAEKYGKGNAVHNDKIIVENYTEMNNSPLLRAFFRSPVSR